MKKTQTILIVTLLFYVALGLSACMYYYVFGTFSPNNITSSNAPSSNEIVGALKEESESTTEESEEPSVEETVVESEVSSEEAVEESTAPNPYYSFEVVNTTKRLHIRTAPSMEADVLAKVYSKTTGYVLEKQDSWSHVIIENNDGTFIDGYAFNEYLDFTEISKEDLPKEYQ